MNRKLRIAGWLAVGSLLAAALLSPAAVSASVTASHHHTGWNDPHYWGGSCGDIKLGPDQVGWHFVLTGPSATSGHLTATFQDAGAITVENMPSQSSSLEFIVVTGKDTLLSFETTDVTGRQLTLAHICGCNKGAKPSESAPVETESAPVETESAPVETESAPVETESAPVETESAPVETESAPVETESAPVETESAPVETESAPVETASVVINPQCPNCPPDASPSGKVDAATGTPHEGITPPATDAITPKSDTSNSGWQLVLLALASLIASALILTPATRRNRR